MQSKLDKRLATACGVAALLALGACGDRSTETAAERAARNEVASDLAQTPLPREEAAARAGARRSGAAELAQGRGS